MGFSYTEVQLDVTTKGFYESDTICNSLKDSVRSGLMGTFFVKIDDFSCRPVEGIILRFAVINIFHSNVFQSIDVSNLCFFFSNK